MKQLIIVLMSILSLAAHSNEHNVYLTEITKIQQNNGFPVETVNITFVKHCTEVLDSVWKRELKSGRVSLGVTVKKVLNDCPMHELEWSYPTVTIELIAEVPTHYGIIKKLNEQDNFISGISVDNFN